MPAFTFEKISPPVRRSADPSISSEPRGVIVQILDRFVVKRAVSVDSSGMEKRVIGGGEPKLPE